MYSLSDYRRMAEDGVRMSAYLEALRRAVRPGCTVLDIGTGPSILALAACSFGARKVYAIEPNGLIQVGRDIARVNGLAGRIEFIQDISTNVSLAERVDVIVSDLRGALPLFRGHLAAILDARNRHLATGGVLIPQRDLLWIAPVDAEKAYSEELAFWSRDFLGYALGPGREIAVNTWHKVRLRPEQILARPVNWASIDYGRVEDVAVAGAARFVGERAGWVHGFVQWFDTELTGGVGYSNAPWAPEMIYGNAFFPLEQPVWIETGDMLEIELRAESADGEYFWIWTSSIRRHRTLVAEFRQSSFLASFPISASRLRKRAETYVPKLTWLGKVDQFILSSFSEVRSSGEIAELVLAKFPGQFRDRGAALARVRKLVETYG